MVSTERDRKRERESILLAEIIPKIRNGIARVPDELRLSLSAMVFFSVDIG